MAKVYLDENGNPIVAKPKVYLDSMGNPIVEAAPAPMASPIQVPRGANVLKAPSGFKRAAQSRQAPDTGISMADLADGLERGLTALFPRTAEAADRSFLRRAAAGSLDAASLPGRMVSSAFANINNDDTSFLDAMAATGDIRGLGEGENIFHSIVRDPLNATLGAGKAVQGTRLLSKLPAVSKLAARVGSAMEHSADATKLVKAAKMLARGGVDVGLPVAVTGAANEFATGRDEYGAPLVVGAASSAIPLAGKLGKKALKPVAELIGKIPNLAYRELPKVIDAAAEAGEALPYSPVAGILSQKNLSGMASRAKLELDKSLSTIDPKELAKEWYRAQIKPGPKVSAAKGKKGQEVIDFEAALNTPGMFRELTGLRDFIGGVKGNAGRNLDRIEALNKASWNPTLKRFEDINAAYSEAARNARALSDSPLDRAVGGRLGPDATDYAVPFTGVRTQDVLTRAHQLGKEAAEAGTHEMSYADLKPAIDAQFHRYAENPNIMDDLGNTGIYDELPLSSAHRAKSNQYKRAYKLGDPNVNPLAAPPQEAASLVGMAHNQVVDELIKKLTTEDFKLRPLATPKLDLPEHISGPFLQEEAPFERFYGARTKPRESSFADFQRERLASGEGLTPEEVSLAALADPSNQSIYKIAEDFTTQQSKINEAEVAKRAEYEADDQWVMRKRLHRNAYERARRQGRELPPKLTPQDYENVRRQAVQNALDDYHADALSPAEQLDEILADFQARKAEPWAANFSKYQTAAQDLGPALNTTRNLDKTMAPWLKAEAALSRAYGRAGNKTSGAFTAPVLSGLGGALAGAGVDYAGDGKIDDWKSPVYGALGGLTLSRAATTPLGPRGLYELGALLDPALRASLTQAPTTASVDALEALLRELSAGSEGNDGIMTDTTSNTRMAGKKRGK